MDITSTLWNSHALGDLFRGGACIDLERVSGRSLTTEGWRIGGSAHGRIRVIMRRVRSGSRSFSERGRVRDGHRVVQWLLVIRPGELALVLALMTEHESIEELAPHDKVGLLDPQAVLETVKEVGLHTLGTVSFLSLLQVWLASTRALTLICMMSMLDRSAHVLFV